MPKLPLRIPTWSTYLVRNWSSWKVPPRNLPCPAVLNSYNCVKRWLTLNCLNSITFILPVLHTVHVYISNGGKIIFSQSVSQSVNHSVHVCISIGGKRIFSQSVSQRRTYIPMYASSTVSRQFGAETRTLLDKCTTLWGELERVQVLNIHGMCMTVKDHTRNINSCMRFTATVSQVSRSSLAGGPEAVSVFVATTEGNFLVHR